MDHRTRCEDAPYVPGAFTINAGDLLARWSGGGSKSDRRLVLPPQAEARKRT